MNHSGHHIGTTQALLAAVVAAMSVPAAAVLQWTGLAMNSGTTCHVSGYSPLGVAAALAGGAVC